MIARYLVSFNLAAIITFALFFSMQMLIASGDIVLEDKIIKPKITFGVFPKPIPPIDDIIQPIRPAVPETIDDKLIPLTQDVTRPVVYNEDPVPGELGEEVPGPTFRILEQRVIL